MVQRETVVAIVACAVGAGIAAATTWWMMKEDRAAREKERKTRRISARSYTLDSGIDKNLTTTTVLPPFPEEIQQLLTSCSLCYLSTSMIKPFSEVPGSSLGHEAPQPHLSLMNFTYHKQEELIILTTRRDTRKLINLMDNPSIALLLHDFPSSRKGESTKGGKTFSITLYGHCVIEDAGSQKEEHYRQLHLARNPEYSQFIEGDNIAVLTVRIDRASICNIKDEVKNWDLKNGVEVKK